MCTTCPVVTPTTADRLTGSRLSAARAFLQDDVDSTLANWTARQSPCLTAKESTRRCVLQSVHVTI